MKLSPLVSYIPLLYLSLSITNSCAHVALLPILNVRLTFSLSLCVYLWVFLKDLSAH